MKNLKVVLGYAGNAATVQQDNHPSHDKNDSDLVTSKEYPSKPETPPESESSTPKGIT